MQTTSENYSPIQILGKRLSATETHGKVTSDQ